MMILIQYGDPDDETAVIYIQRVVMEARLSTLEPLSNYRMYFLLLPLIMLYMTALPLLINFVTD